MNTNNRRFLFYFSLCVVLAFAALPALAGVSTSGGGTGVVCRSPEGKITSVELLDLYEVKARGQTLIPDSGASGIESYLASVDRVWQLQSAPIVEDQKFSRQNYENFMKKVQWIQPGEHLAFLNDVGHHPPLPQGCALEQIAIFYDVPTQVIAIDRELWDLLALQDQTALVWHELTYMYFRGLKDNTSEYARTFVSMIFAQETVPVLEGISKDQPSCFSEGATRSFFYKIPQNSATLTVRFQFFSFLNRPLVNKTYADLVLEKDSSGLPVRKKYSVIGGLSAGWAIEIVPSAEKIKINYYDGDQLLEEQTLTYCSK
jgi:hypothetical protein